MKPARLVALLTLALTATAIAPGTSSAAPGLVGGFDSAVVGHVYVNDNTGGENTVAAFDRHADGALTPIPGSPFPAGGAGTGAGIGSQGALQESADGKYLLAVDAGSGQISVLRSGQTEGFAPSVVDRSPRAGPSRSASRSTEASCMWPTAGRARTTTRALRSTAEVICARLQARRSCCPKAQNQATFCSTRREPTSSGCASKRR